MKIQEFLASPFARQRYWARNYVAYPRFSSVHPNVTHRALKAWEESGKLSVLCTQNVDGLHKRAGSRNLVELHGTSHRVKCISSCGYEVDRAVFQDALAKVNEGLHPAQGGQIRPDGDITIDEVKSLHWAANFFVVNVFVFPDRKLKGNLRFRNVHPVVGF